MSACRQRRVRSPMVTGAGSSFRAVQRQTDARDTPSRRASSRSDKSVCWVVAIAITAVNTV